MVRHFAWRGTLTQPWGVPLFEGIWKKHPRWMTKTIMVENNDVEEAFHLLNKMMDKEGLLKIIRNTERYLKPTKQRRALSYDASNAILNEDLQYKMKFMMKKNRPDPFPGQITTT